MNATGGKVTDCDIVLKQSKEYQCREDFWYQYIEENLLKVSGQNLKQSLVQRDFKLWYNDNFPGKRVPASKELVDMLDIKLGPRRRKKWVGWTIKQFNDEFESDEENEIVSSSS